MKVNKYAALMLLFMVQLIFACSSTKQKKLADTGELKIQVPLRGNAWIGTDLSLNEKMISEQGLVNWNEESSIVRTFVRVNGSGVLSLGIKAKIAEGSSQVKISLGNVSKQISIETKETSLIPVGQFKIEQEGYVQIDMQGISKTAASFGEVSHFVLGGEATAQGTDFVNDDFYWGRRGPSVHLAYKIPEAAGDVEWFYNEIEVPEGNDIPGSYYMANGFGEGYFGIQVNSKTERRILFSVWSPFKTDNPLEIPEEQKIKLLKKGENVRTGEFGNEGSGGQSYRVFNWQTGNRYRFLLRTQPTKNQSTDYTAYFFAPEIGKWELIASFRRPKTSTYLKHLHSFLENFLTEMGQFSRKVSYCNQWVRNTKGEWFELTEAKFTADATARKNARLDYAGGAEEQHFYLKNCGFFSDKTTIDSFFKRESLGRHPEVNFNELP